MLQSLTPSLLGLRGPYQRYHPILKVFAATGMVPVEVKCNIPTSTWSEWCHADYSHAIGHDLFDLIRLEAPVLDAYLSREAFYSVVRAVYQLLLTIEAIVVQVRGVRTSSSTRPVRSTPGAESDTGSLVGR